MTAHRLGIVGYGNLGRGVELAVSLQEDMELVGVFTRRDPSTLTTAFEDTAVRPMDALESMTGEIDVLVLCGGSKSDLPEQTPQLATRFTVVDSFDTHARIPAPPRAPRPPRGRTAPPPPPGPPPTPRPGTPRRARPAPRR